MRVQLSDIRLINLYNIRKNLFIYKKTQYIFTRTIKNFFEFYINSYSA